MLPRMTIATLCLSFFLPLASARAADLFEAINLLPEPYRPAAVRQLAIAEDNQPQLIEAITRLKPEHRAAIGFLIEHMPERDLTTLTADFLVENIELAYQARNEVPWGADLPEELFFEYVLPYANVNEQRDNWRKTFYEKFIDIAKTCQTPGEALVRLNVEAFKAYGVAYHPTKRPKPDMSPFETMEAKYASCTGLSIMLIDVCRAVCIPARFVGTPSWTQTRGNHSWVEGWDRQWNYIGACEGGGLNSGWFVGNAAAADNNSVIHRIYAASYKQTNTHFPLVWKIRSTEVPAHNVTPFYTHRRPVTFRLTEGDANEPLTATVTVYHNGVIVAHGSIGSDAKPFLIAAGETYTVKVAADEFHTTQTIAVPEDEAPLVTIQRKG